MPPLRERASDIPLLVEHFVRAIASEYGAPEKRLDAAAMEALCGMPWTGNIRELRNAVERLLILGGDPVTLDDVAAYCG